MKRPINRSSNRAFLLGVVLKCITNSPEAIVLQQKHFLLFEIPMFQKLLGVLMVLKASTPL